MHHKFTNMINSEVIYVYTWLWNSTSGMWTMCGMCTSIVEEYLSLKCDSFLGSSTLICGNGHNQFVFFIEYDLLNDKKNSSSVP